MKDNEVSGLKEFPGPTFQFETKLKYRILVVDDDSAVREFHTKMLSERGYEVDSACDGDLGWKAIQTNHYHLVITDNSMPKVTGVELLEKIDLARIDVSAIMVTSTVPKGGPARHPWLTKVVMLEKPVRGEVLASLVDQVLNPIDQCVRGGTVWK